MCRVGNGEKAPVALFVYRRQDKVEMVLEALEKNRSAEQTDLLIFCDGYKGEQDRKQVESVREYIRQYKTRSRFRNVFIYESAVNKGLADSIISGVTVAMERYGKAIIVEDDLLTSEDFLDYMNGGLDFYGSDPRYGSISAYTYPLKELKRYKEDVYVLRKGECWGWATWKDRWDGVDWQVKNFETLYSDADFRRGFCELQAGIDQMLCDWKEGRVDSWAVRWVLHLYLKKQLTVYPAVSRTRNIGFDDSGTNCGITYIADSMQIGSDERCRFKKMDVDARLEHAVAIYNTQGSRVRYYLGKIQRKFKAYRDKGYIS